MTQLQNINDDAESSYHYSVIRRAIERLDRIENPIPLEQIAQEMGMSPAHFQRLFSRWVGVSPKRYQQFLALGHAKTLLRDRFTTLDASHAVGLSGSGRLHDLFVRWEAMSPGDFAQNGHGLVINWGWFESPFGPAIVMGTDRGICGIGFAAEMGEDAAMEDLKSRWPGGIFTEGREKLRPWVRQVFGSGDGSQEKTPLVLIGAPFQIKVWEALLSIPSGYVTTYTEIAAAVGAPRAVRAVGTAVGRNPISWLIPCHRAVRKSGGLGGYHWGLPMKRAMLAFETARSQEAETAAG